MFEKLEGSKEATKESARLIKAYLKNDKEKFMNILKENLKIGKEKDKDKDKIDNNGNRNSNPLDR